MKSAEYRQRFIAGMDLLAELDSRCDRDEVARDKRHVEAVGLGENLETYRAVVSTAAFMARQWLRPHDPWEVVGRRCLDFSHGFHRLWEERTKGALLKAWLTVGDVRNRGESIHGADRAKVERRVRRGLAADAPPDVHVWLTFEDMSVLDVTIMAALLRLGRVSPEQYMRNPVVFGRPEALGDFQFVPILVDDDFRAKVERRTPPRLPMPDRLPCAN